MTDVVPTEQGQDVTSRYRSHDAHIRLEPLTYPSGTTNRAGPEHITVDVFDSSVVNPAEAHVESEEFPNTPAGAAQATEFLRSWGFDYTVKLR